MTVWRRAKKVIEETKNVIPSEPKIVEKVIDNLMENNKAPAGKAINKILGNVKKMSSKRSLEITTGVCGSGRKKKICQASF